MTHIDEGTIHAWLDGALDATQAREVEMHVHECASCAASVAEARGLIAGSSRILNALDDVPANVVPIGSKRALVPAAAVAQRRWRVAPWVTSIAAVLLLAVVLRRPGDEATMMAGDAAMPIAQSEASTTFLGDTVPRRAKAVPATTAPAGQADQRIAVTSGSPSRQRASVVTVVTVATGAGTAGVARDELAADMAAVAPAAPPPQSHRKSTETVTLRDVAQKPGSDMAGCYTIPVALPPARSLAASPSLQRARGESRPTSAPAAAEVVQRINPVYVVAKLIRTVRDSGYVARDAQSDSVLGTWFVMAADSAEVMLKNGLVVRVSRNARSDCPRE